jgi:hypothetical protein
MTARCSIWIPAARIELTVARKKIAASTEDQKTTFGIIA